MDLSLTDRQETLKTTAREFFERECPTTLVRAMEGDSRGYTTDLWEGMADLGWMGLPFPSEYGGSDGTLTDLAVLLEEFGRALVPGPFFNSVAVVGLAILDAGTERLRSELLPRIADGSLIATAALLESDARYGTASVKLCAERQNDGLSLNGTKMFVEYADSTDLLLVPARTGEGETWLYCWFPDPPMVLTTTPLESINREPQHAVHFEDVAVDDGADSRRRRSCIEDDCWIA